MKGVGVATAMEIVGTFGTLEDFKGWWQGSGEADGPDDVHGEAKKRLVLQQELLRSSPFLQFLLAELGET